MPPPGLHLLETLTSTHLTTLTTLLTLPPLLSPTNPHHLSSQTHTISRPTFPSKLKTPKPLLLRLALHAYPTIFQKAHLCPTHSPLNPYLIRRIFIQVTAEATVRLGRLLASPYPLPAHVQVFVARLQALNGLWMSAELYRGIRSSVSREGVDECGGYERIESDCEACILSRIGGDKQALSDLRTNMLGRRKKRGPKPRLLVLVESWIANLLESEKNEVLTQSDRLGREVSEIRRSMQKERRRRKDEISKQEIESKRRPSELDARGIGRRSVEMAKRARDPGLIWSGSSDTAAVPICYRSGSEEEPLLRHAQEPDGREDSGDEHDPVESIIDFCGHRLSTAFAPRTSMHPAFRDSLIFDHPSGTFHHRQSRPNTPLPQYIPQPPVPNPNPRNTIHELADTRPQHRAEVYTPSLYTHASTYELASTTFAPSRRNSTPFPSSLRHNAEERAREYRNLVGDELNEDRTASEARDHRRLLHISEASELSSRPNTPQGTPAWSTTPTVGRQQQSHNETQPRAHEQRWDGEDVPHPRHRLTRVEARRRSGEEERMRVAELDGEDITLRRGTAPTRAENRSTRWSDFYR